MSLPLITIAGKSVQPVDQIDRALDMVRVCAAALSDPTNLDRANTCAVMCTLLNAIDILEPVRELLDKDGAA